MPVPVQNVSTLPSPSWPLHLRVLPWDWPMWICAGSSSLSPVFTRKSASKHVMHLAMLLMIGEAMGNGCFIDTQSLPASCGSIRASLSSSLWRYKQSYPLSSYRRTPSLHTWVPMEAHILTSPNKYISLPNENSGEYNVQLIRKCTHRCLTEHLKQCYVDSQNHMGS